MKELSVTEQAILRTVLYSSMFDYPLTMSELRENLLELEMKEQDIREAYEASDALNSVIDYQDGYFFPEGRRELIALRQWRRAHSERILSENRWVLKLICCIPHVRMVALSGSVSHLNLEIGGDIDLFIVTRRNRVWSVAVEVLLLRRLLGKYRVICPNLILSDSQLVINQTDLFNANQIIHLKPLIGLEMYRRFVDANDFITVFYPNYPFNDSSLDFRPHWALRGFKKIVEGILLPGGGLQELVCRSICSWYLNRKSKYWKSPEEVVMEKEFIKLHTESHRKVVMQKFERVVAETMRVIRLKKKSVVSDSQFVQGGTHALYKAWKVT